MSDQLAARLHSVSTRLVRLARRDRPDEGLSSSRRSALAVLAASGPLSLAELAAREQVRAPTMSRIVESLVREELVTREARAEDRRSVRIEASAKGRALLSERKPRAAALATRLQSLGDSEQRALLRGVELLERITRN